VQGLLIRKLLKILKCQTKKVCSYPRVDLPIDYSTTWGLKQWTESMKKLSDNLFDGSPQNLKMFLERLASRVITAGWKTITKINGKDL